MNRAMNDSDDRSFDELSIPEQILHVQDLWDRIPFDRPENEVTEAQRLELERRLLEHETNPSRTLSWDDVNQRLGRST